MLSCHELFQHILFREYSAPLSEALQSKSDGFVALGIEKHYRGQHEALQGGGGGSIMPWSDRSVVHPTARYGSQKIKSNYPFIKIPLAV